MPKVYQINEKQVAELESARKKNTNKNIEKRIKALLLRSQGKNRAEIALLTGFAKTYISKLVANYCNNGLSAIAENNYHGNHRNLKTEDEAELLESFKKQAEQGQIVEVSAIKAAYEEKIGRKVNSNGHIYLILQRHGWRKVMPRSKHPNKASEEAICASKKLTLELMK
jgi:transposase